MDTSRKLLAIGGTILVLVSLVPLVVTIGPAVTGPALDTIPRQSAQRLSVTLVSLVTLAIGGVFLFRFVHPA